MKIKILLASRQRTVHKAAYITQITQNYIHLDAQGLTLYNKNSRFGTLNLTK